MQQSLSVTAPAGSTLVARQGHVPYASTGQTPTMRIGKAYLRGY